MNLATFEESAQPKHGGIKLAARWYVGIVHVAAGFMPACFCFAILLFSQLLIAQQRPLLTEDPRITAPGTVTSELGFGYLDRARFPVSGLGGNELQFLVNGLHFGLGDRSEFQIAGVAHNFLWVHENGTGRRNDWGDFSLSTKIKLVDEKGARPIISFRPTVILPNTNNEKGLGTDGTHFFGSLLFGKTFSRRLFLFGNLGLGILDDAVRAAAQQDVLAYGIAALFPVSERFRLAAEANGWDNAQSNPSPGGEDRGQARLGVQVAAGGVRWDIAATAGLTRWDHRAGVVFGMTKEFRLWK